VTIGKVATTSEKAATDEKAITMNVPSTSRWLEAWIHEYDRVMLVQDVTRTDNVMETWAGGEHGAILLDDGEYLDTKDMTSEEVDAWATRMDFEDTACITSPLAAGLAAVRAEVLQALAKMTHGASEFLEESEYEHEYGQDTFDMPELFQAFKKEESKRSGIQESHIVSPSGYATSMLHLQLQYPPPSLQRLSTTVKQ